MNMKTLKMYFVIIVVMLMLVGCDGDTSKHPENNGTTNDTQKPNDENPEVTPEINKSTRVDAVFLNWWFIGYYESYMSQNRKPFLQEGEDVWVMDYTGEYTQIMSRYEWEENDDRLFAFVVQFGDCAGEEPDDCPKLEDYKTEDEYMFHYRIYRRKVLIESMKKRNIEVVSNYPYTGRGVRFSQNVEYLSYHNSEGTYSATVVLGTIDELKEIFCIGEAVDGWNYRLISAPRPDMIRVAKEKGYDLNRIHKYTDGMDAVLGPENQVTVNVMLMP